MLALILALLLGAQTPQQNVQKCTVAALLAALEEADREFIEDPNERDEPEDSRDWIPPRWDNGITLLPAPGNLVVRDRDNRTPAKKLRDEAEAEAQELERKSAAARRIRATLSACKKVTPVAPNAPPK